MFFRRGAARESTPKCDHCRRILKVWKSETMAMISSMCAPFISAENRLKLFGISPSDAELTFFDYYHCWCIVVSMLLFSASDIIKEPGGYYIYVHYLAILVLVSPFLR